MNINDEDGGTAFPFARYNVAKGGMSLRDYFAAKALHALMIHTLEYPTHPDTDPANYSKRAYQFADAMLAERLRKE